jgi:arylsulfatase A-like enzyme
LLAQDKKPNVVFILADNVGYGDLGSYGGGELRGEPTPRLDELAQEGLRLTQFLVEPACTPSRAALMTGQYSIRNGLSLIAIEGSPYTLSAGAFTTGEMFKGVGYATAIFGEWHLGSTPRSLPTAHGFDEFYGSRRTFRGMRQSRIGLRHAQDHYGNPEGRERPAANRQGRR